jgi:hypothetical protein
LANSRAQLDRKSVEGRVANILDTPLRLNVAAALAFSDVDQVLR